MMFAGQMIFVFNDTATTEIYTLSLHDALPIFAVQVTVVVPLEKVEPEGGVQLVVTPEQLSAAVRAEVDMAEHHPGSAGLMLFALEMMVGGCVSVTVTVKLQLAGLPAAFVALQV